MPHEKKPVWHVVREHAIHYVIGGVFLSLTGFAPEEWLARAANGLRLPQDVLHLGATGIDPRMVTLIGGMGLIGFGLLRRQRPPLPAAAPATGPPAETAAPSAEARPDASAPATDERAALALPNKPSIAVLPFTNLSGDPDQEYFSEGVVEDIITALSRASWLFVIARNSSFTYKGRAVDVKQVGRELGVRYVLEGSVRKAGGRVRITGQLIDATTGAHLWADNFDGMTEDVFQLQDSVTASVAGAIEPRLQRAEIERALHKPTQNLDAYDYYLRGLAAFHRATAESVAEALELFNKAVGLDPGYGAAYGMAAWCFGFRKSFGLLAAYDSEIAEGVRLARLAVSVGRDDAMALWTGGHALAFLGGELDAGMQMIERACGLNPNLASAWMVAGWTRVYRGEFAPAIAAFERSLRLSPLDPFLYVVQGGIACAHFLERRYDDALAWAEQSLNEQPSWFSAARLRIAVLALSGRTEAARRAWAELDRVQPGIRLADVDRWMPPFRRPEDTALYSQGLREAGVPE
jgi:TolB-like protein